MAFIVCLQPTHGLHCLLTASRPSLSAYSLLMAFIVCLQSILRLQCLLTNYSGPSLSHGHFSVYSLLRAFFLFTVWPGPSNCLHSIRAFIVCLKSTQGRHFCLQSTKGLLCLFIFFSGPSMSADILSVFVVCLQSTQCLDCLLTVYSGPSLSAHSHPMAFIICLHSTQYHHWLFTVRAFIVCTV